LGGAFFLCLQGIREMTEDKMPILWEQMRGARSVGENWERVDQPMVFLQRADQVGYVGGKKKARY
jgi:hypothetical protein